MDAARKIIRSLNADVRIIEANYSDVPADTILDTGLFDFDKAHEHPMWAKELYGYADHTPETEEYGVTSYVYRARRPFEPEAIHRLLNGPLAGVIRAKGHFWIATRPDWVAEFSLAGALSSILPLGTWWASVPRERWPAGESIEAYMKDNWREPLGDRRQEIVFIGAGIDWPQLKARLDAALIPEEVPYSPDAAPVLPDPFPQWRRAEPAALVKIGPPKPETNSSRHRPLVLLGYLEQQAFNPLHRGERLQWPVIYDDREHQHLSALRY